MSKKIVHTFCPSCKSETCVVEYIKPIANCFAVDPKTLQPIGEAYQSDIDCSPTYRASECQAEWFHIEDLKVSLHDQD